MGDNRSRGAAITANPTHAENPTTFGDALAAAAAQHHPVDDDNEWWEEGEGEACSGVHVGGHATVANAAVIPRGFVGRQSVTDLLRRRSGRFAGVACSSTHATATRSALYRHNGARQHHSVGRSLCSVQAAGVHGETTRSLESHKHRHT